MQDNTQDSLKDAMDIARRTNLQVLVVAGGLLLAWTVNLEDNYAKILGDFDVIAGLEQRRDNLDAIKSTLRSQQSKLERDIELLRGGEKKSSGDKLQEIHGKHEAITKIKQQIQNAARTHQLPDVTKTLNERITFEIGQGIRLPFSFQIASLVWLMLICFLLARIGLQRAKFWRLIAEAVLQSRAETGIGSGQRLVDVPVWLAPVPRRHDLGFVLHHDLAEAAGWRRSASSRWIVSCCIGLAAALVLARVAWIGLVVNGSAGYVNQMVGVNRLNGSPLVGLAILAAAAIGLVLIIWLCLPASVSTSVHSGDVTQVERRALVAAMLGTAFVFMLRTPQTRCILR